jgi:ATP-dependent protease ClpP protease subunit
MKEFYKFRCAADDADSAELLIFDAIGDWEDMGEVSAKMLARDLAKLPASVKRLDIHINSPGGSLFEASAIYSRLADHRSKKMVFVDGLAASAASIVAMVGHKIYIRANAQMMIHLPSGIAMGNADDMRKMAAALDSVTESMLNVYASRTGQERDDIRQMLADETWLAPDKAVELGFADEVRGVVKAAAQIDATRAIFNGAEFDISRFHNLPAFHAYKPKDKTMPSKVKNEKKKDDDENGNGNGNGEGDEGKEETQTPTPPAQTPHPQTPAAQPTQRTDPAAASDFDKGIAAERARVSALQALDRPATHEIIVNAIKDGKTAADVTAACIDAMDKAGKQNARREDGKILGQIPGSEGGNGGTDDEKKAFGTLIKNKVAERQKTMRFQHSRN